MTQSKPTRSHRARRTAKLALNRRKPGKRKPGPTPRRKPNRTAARAFKELRKAVSRATGFAIREWREARGWTREDLSTLLCHFGSTFSVSTIVRWEQGTISLRASEQALLEALCAGVAEEIAARVKVHVDAWRVDHAHLAGEA